MAGVLILGCLQGPWDYYPEKTPYYKGLFVSGYVIADNPVSNVCVEKMFELDEEYTNAFVFYENAELEITGEFSGSEKTITLSPDSENVNCFVGPADELPSRGNDYVLNGTVQWDSAGVNVSTSFSATASIPQNFSVKDTAKAPYFAKNLFEQLDSNANPISEFGTLLNSLPEEVREELAESYLDTVLQMFSEGDTLAAFAYVFANQKEIEAIISKAEVTFVQDDSLWYLGGSLNTLSHYFASERSADVGAVLVSQYYNPDSSIQPRTAFSGFFGIEPDTSDYFQLGEGNRLIIYPEAVGPGGWNLLDNIGIVNSWYVGGRNLLKFYGFQKEYYDYAERTIQEESNSKVEPFYNVDGAAGIFVGAIADSFEVNIKVPESVESYPFSFTRPFYCEENGWFESAFCRNYYPEHCREIDYGKPYCARALLSDTLPKQMEEDYMLEEFEMSKKRFDFELEMATINYCMQNEFEDSQTCQTPIDNCREEKGINPCKEELWTYCLDNKWLAQDGKPTGICAWGLVSYCTDKPRQSEVLCQKADAYCEENSDEKLCE